MLGNVCEWCRDWYAEKVQGGSDPQGSDGRGRVLRNGDVMDAGFRVLRGGCWRSPGPACRSAFRSMSEPGERDDIVGSRVVLDAPTKDEQKGRKPN
jgi:formylglycine-generating enzyme required for sulfatase activity